MSSSAEPGRFTWCWQGLALSTVLTDLWELRRELDQKAQEDPS